VLAEWYFFFLEAATFSDFEGTVDNAYFPASAQINLFNDMSTFIDGPSGCVASLNNPSR